MIGKDLLIYMDDINVKSIDIKSHLIHHSKLQEAGLKHKLKKCNFFQMQNQYLGHIVDEAGIKPDPQKL